MAKHKIHWLTGYPDRWGAYVYCGRWLDRWHPMPLEERTVRKLTESGVKGDSKKVTCGKCLKLMREGGMMI